jgi:cell division GTPase FtsZ
LHIKIFYKNSSNTIVSFAASAALRGTNNDSSAAGLEENVPRITRCSSKTAGTDMVFITGGMGGGTCTGAAPLIAQIAKKELGNLTIGVVTKPFLFEGTRRMTNAEEGISQLRENVDTLIVIPNQKVMEVVNNKATLLEAFKIDTRNISNETERELEVLSSKDLLRMLVIKLQLKTLKIKTFSIKMNTSALIPVS